MTPKSSDYSPPGDIRVEHSNLSLEEIQRQLEEADNKKAQLEKLLKDKREEGKGAVVEQIRKLIPDKGS